MSGKISEVEKRIRQISQQLEHLRSQLLKKTRAHYPDVNVYSRQVKRTRELLSELESELLILNCPGEYDELPVAIVADELGLKYEQVRSLIKLGEIAASGMKAHEGISRTELERITTVGVPTLLRMSNEDSAEIFEQAISLLQNGDLDAAKSAYRRLEGRESWEGAYAPAFLIGFELASGDLDGVMSSVKLICECDDLPLRLSIMSNLRRLLREMKLNDDRCQELRAQLIRLSEGATTKNRLVESHRPNYPKEKLADRLQQQAIYLTTAVVKELSKYQPCNMHSMFNGQPQTSEQETCQIMQNAIYTALHAETFYEESSSSRRYFDMLSSMIPENYPPAKLLKEE